MWQTTEDKAKVTNILKVYQKLKHVARVLSKTSDVKNSTCTMLLLWHHSHIKWVQIPCNEEILDWVSIYCMKHTYFNTSSRYITNIEQGTGLISTSGEEQNMGNIHICKFQGIISSRRVCDGKNDCAIDESVCEKEVNNIPMKDILSVKWVHKRVVSYFPSIDDMKDVVEQNTEMKWCVYEIHKTNRTSKYEMQGRQLEECQTVLCNNTWKCPGYYCLPYRHICDGLWDCPWGYDENNCISVEKPGFFHCSDTLIYILPGSINLQWHI